MSQKPPHRPHYLCLKNSTNNMKGANFLEHKEDILRTKQCVNNVLKDDLTVGLSPISVPLQG
jgi:hypothetical protein